MGDKPVTNKSESAILSEIKTGKIYSEGTDHTYSLSGDVADACIDSSRYSDPLGIRLFLSEEIVDLLDRKDNVQDKFKIAELDKANIIAAYLATCQRYSSEDIHNLLVSNNEYLSSVGVGLAVIYGTPHIIPKSNIEGLYKYFRSREIAPDELKHFTSYEFMGHSFRRMLQEERVIFTWMINNLISLVDAGAVDIEENAEFFVSLLKDNDYPNETHKNLFLLALKKQPSFIENLLKIDLKVDPFTKQNNFSKWLKEVKKFMFISGLRDSLPEEYGSEGVSWFDKRRSELYRINRNDRSLEM